MKFLSTHGQSETRLYYIWSSMKSRCLNINNKSFQNYGGRGIRVCEEWLQSFEAFATWAHENGYADNLTIDRVDNDKDYTPDNCRWVDRTTQSRNRRNNRFLTYKGQTKTLGEWGEEVGINSAVIWKRLYHYGWSAEKALFTPVKHFTKRANEMLITHHNSTKSLLEWSKETGINAHTLYYRITSLGWAVDKALTTPSNKNMKEREKCL